VWDVRVVSYLAPIRIRSSWAHHRCHHRSILPAKARTRDRIERGRGEKEQVSAKEGFKDGRERGAARARARE